MDGLGRALLLRLNNTPPEDTIEAVIQVWFEVITGLSVAWDEELDAGRITRGFRVVLAKVDRFPTPKQLIEALPPRKPLPALPPEKLDPETIKRNKAKLDAILKTLTQGLKK